MATKQVMWTLPEILMTTKVMLRERWKWSAVVLFLIVGLGLYHVITGAPVGASGGTLGGQSPISPRLGGLGFMGFGLFLLGSTWYFTHLARFEKSDKENSEDSPE